MQLNVFLSRSADDRKYSREFKQAVAGMEEYDKSIKVWDFSENMYAGADWVDEVKKRLAVCDIFVALLSGSYWAKQACNEEWAFALENCKRIRVVPVWAGSWLSDQFRHKIQNQYGLTMYPTNGKPLSETKAGRSRGWMEVAAAIEKIVNEGCRIEHTAADARRAISLPVHREEFSVVKLGQDQLKIFPRESTAQFPVVSFGRVHEETAQIQNKLRQLSELHFSAATDSRELPCRELLKNLADDGRRLKHILFGNGFCALRSDLARHRTQYLIRMTHESLPHIPWGLLYDGDLGRIDQDEHLVKDFWGMKFNVACVYDSSLDPDLMLRPADFKLRTEDVLRIYHPDALGVLNTNSIDRLHFKPALLKTREQLRQAVTRAQGALLTYFFCDSHDSQLRFGGQDESEGSVTDRQLRNWTAQSRGSGLFFLNGCKPWGEKGGAGWLRATREGAFLGLLGTEAVVPTRFAWEFGADFLHLLLSQGMTCGEAMLDMRSRHSPLSLLYGLYCLPQAKVVCDDVTQFSISAPDKKNLSNMDMGHLTQSAVLPFGEIGATA